MLIMPSKSLTFDLHEMGHVYGLGHSFSNDRSFQNIDWSQGGEYDDWWDIMSAANVYPTVRPNATSLRTLGWIDETEVVRLEPWRPEAPSRDARRFARKIRLGHSEHRRRGSKPALLVQYRVANVPFVGYRHPRGSGAHPQGGGKRSRSCCGSQGECVNGLKRTLIDEEMGVRISFGRIIRGPRTVEVEVQRMAPVAERSIWTEPPTMAPTLAWRITSGNVAGPASTPSRPPREGSSCSTGGGTAP